MPTSKRLSSVAEARHDSFLRLLSRWLLLCLCHVVYGALFLLEHLVRRPWRSGFSESRGTSLELQRDARQWEKLPRHVAIAFSPSEGSRWRPNEARGTAERVRQIADDVSKLARWCLELQVERVSVYDARGLARYNSAIFCEQLSKQLHVVSPPFQGKAPDSPPPSLLVALTSDTASPTCRISLLSGQDGKQHVALVATKLKEAVSQGYIKASDVTLGLLQEKMQSSLITEPDLLIVLGEPSLRLHGFPPWHIRLTEIYHEPSLSLLGPARLSYRTFRRALSAYSASEQRRGK